MQAEGKVVELGREREVPAGPPSFEELFLEVHVTNRSVRASQYFEIDKFSPQMWELSTTYPKDAAMYEDETLTNYRLNEKSIRLWEQHTREYVRAVRASQGQ